MGRAWLLSSLLHIVIAVAAFFGLPTFSRLPPTMPQAVTVDLGELVAAKASDFAPVAGEKDVEIEDIDEDIDLGEIPF
jgi:hypothetical protein